MEHFDFVKFLQVTLKLHQIFALVDVSFDQLGSPQRNKTIIHHFSQIAEQLRKHNGLNYVPRDRTIDGRVFEHAADCKVLIDLLAKIEVVNDLEDVQMSYVEVAGEEDDASSTADRNKQMQSLKITDENILMSINEAFVNLTIKADGKADLYFNAYFWDKYLSVLKQHQDSLTDEEIKQ